MNKIAVFGKPGSGKSVLSKSLSSALGLELYPLDSMLYDQEGQPVERTTFDKLHQTILMKDSWIIDGLGPLRAFNERLERADTLIYVDLPYWLSYWLVTKRLIKSPFVHPEGWPKNSSVVTGTVNSYKTLQLCPKFWNDEFVARVQALGKDKNVYVVKTLGELNSFVALHT
ncbi:adenylate kinase [Pseudoalteromonas sp. T1lg23B]|uniref:adenylate kinase n=1 Tax=Pseudoalteromonas sp. T1lg23B TaxID=2077097 RepID=UPI000CF74DAC|nr:adenylate kinase [Pseudoalteromonas sp. T1lg23B]